MDIIIKLLIFIIGILIGVIFTVIFASARRKGLEDRMDIMRIASGKQDETIRQKQVRIATLEREIRRMRRRER